MTTTLRTRNIGMVPDASGHPLAPMEIVYEAEPPPKRRRWTWRRVWAEAFIVLFTIGWSLAIIFSPWWPF